MIVRLCSCEPCGCVCEPYASCILNLKTMSSYIFMICEPYFHYIFLYILLQYHIYIHRFKVFVVGSIKRSNLNEAAVQPVLNGWTNEPLNRRPRRFVLRSGSKNYGCLPWALLHRPGTCIRIIAAPCWFRFCMLQRSRPQRFRFGTNKLQQPHIVGFLHA